MRKKGRAGLMAGFEIIHRFTTLETREAHETRVHTECASQPAANQIIFLIVSFRDMSRNTENTDVKKSLIFITLTLSLSWGVRVTFHQSG